MVVGSRVGGLERVCEGETNCHAPGFCFRAKIGFGDLLRDVHHVVMRKRRKMMSHEFMQVTNVRFLYVENNVVYDQHIMRF